MGVLAGSNMVTHVVAEVVSGHQDGAGGGGAGHGQEGEADKGLKSFNLTETSHCHHSNLIGKLRSR